MRTLRISSLLKSAGGFSLTEIMIGGGILAGVALSGAQMFKDQKLAQRRVDSQQKLTIYHQALAKRLAAPGHCNATMKAAGLATATSIPAGFTFSRIAACTSNCVEADGTQDLRAIHAGVGAASQDILRAGMYIDDTKMWEVVDIKHGPNALTQSGPLILRVKYRLDPKIAKSNNVTETKDIVLNARFADVGGTKVFQECVSAQESSVNNLQNDFCKSLNFGNIDSVGSTSGQLARWDEKTQTCIVGVDKTCPGGSIVDGISSTGEVKCKPLINEHDADILANPATSEQCASGKNAKLKYVDGKFQIVCE